MTEDKMMRLSLVAKQIGVGTSTIVQKLSVQGHKVENNPNAKLNFEQLKIVAKEFGASDLLQTKDRTMITCLYTHVIHQLNQRLLRQLKPQRLRRK
jgi:hypothetical protein